MFSLTLSHQAQVKEPNKKQKTVFREAGQNKASSEIQSLFVVKNVLLCIRLLTVRGLCGQRPEKIALSNAAAAKKAAGL